jgi:ATP-dependent DNA helicase RecG
LFDLFRKKAAKSRRVSAAILKEDNNSLIENLRLKDDQYFKRAALLLFHNDPEEFFQGSFIKIGFFQSDTELIYQDEIHGSLFVQAEKAFDLIVTKYLKAYISYEGINRVEQFLFPTDALREALLNAVVHKDYSSGIPIQIKVFDDRIIIWNEGHLPKSWTVAKLKKQHPSKPFNPDIANAFFRAGLIESWGRGIEKIVYECKKHGIPVPEFRYESDTFMVEFNARVLFRNMNKSAAGNALKEEGGGGRKRWSEKVVGKGGQKLTAKQQELVEVLEKTPRLTRKNISELFDINESAVQKRINTLKQKGVLKREGGAKGGFWKVIKPDSPAD